MIAAAMTAFLASASEALHIPRVDDAVGGYRIVPRSLPMTRSIDVVDLSRARAISPVEIKVSRAGEDSVYFTFAGSSRLLKIMSDTTLLLSEGQRGLFYDCLVPEPDFQQSASAPYYRCGNAGGIDFREYGTLDLTGIPISRFIPQEGDTISGAYLKRTVFTGSLNTAGDHTGTDWLELVASDDSINAALGNFVPLSDSICKITLRENIYSPGYRYPILSQERCMLYAYGVPVDSASSAFLFPTGAQALLDDPENEDVRNEDRHRPFVAPAPPKGHGMLETRLSVSAFPTITDSSIEIMVDNNAGPVTLRVLSTSGKTMIATELSQDGPQRTTMDLSGLQAGIYLVTANDRESSISLKIAKF